MNGDQRHRELLTLFGGKQTVVKIYFENEHKTLLYTGELSTWNEFFIVFRPYFRWRIRPEGNDVAVIITNQRSGWVRAPNTHV